MLAPLRPIHRPGGREIVVTQERFASGDQPIQVYSQSPFIGVRAPWESSGL
jgi:hypothetical protein